LGDITSLKVRKATRDRLARLGGKSETYDEIINRVLNDYEKGLKPRHGIKRGHPA